MSHGCLCHVHQPTWMSQILKQISIITKYLYTDNWIESWGSTTRRPQKIFHFTLIYLPTVWLNSAYTRIWDALEHPRHDRPMTYKEPWPAGGKTTWMTQCADTQPGVQVSSAWPLSSFLHPRDVSAGMRHDDETSWPMMGSLALQLTVPHTEVLESQTESYPECWTIVSCLSLSCQRSGCGL